MRPVRPELTYIAEDLGRDDPELVAIRRQLAEQGLEYMSVALSEVRILQFLSRGFGIRRVIEIGAPLGYSSVCTAKALPQDGRIISIEHDVERCAVANARESSVAAKTDVRCGDALAELREIKGPVDMVFIDANKSGYLA